MLLETPRLILRPFLPDDLAGLQEILGDRETMAYCEPPYAPEQTRRFLSGFCMQEQGAVAAVHRETGRIIGYFLFHPLEPGIIELGWFLNRAFWRQGYAFEAAQRLIRYAFEDLSARELQAETADPIRSAGLLQKLGFAPSGPGGPVHLPDGSLARLVPYVLRRENWPDRPANGEPV